MSKFHFQGGINVKRNKPFGVVMGGIGNPFEGMNDMMDEQQPMIREIEKVVGPVDQASIDKLNEITRNKQAAGKTYSATIAAAMKEMQRCVQDLDAQEEAAWREVLEAHGFTAEQAAEKNLTIDKIRGLLIEIEEVEIQGSYKE